MSANLRDLAGRLIRPRMGRRLAALTLSLVVIGACVAVFKTVGFGTDPCSTFTLGVSAHTGVSFGTCQLLFNLLMFIPVFRYDVSRIGIGTIGNMVGIGYIADLCMELMRPLIPAEGLSMNDSSSGDVRFEHGRVLDCRGVLHGGGSGRGTL